MTSESPMTITEGRSSRYSPDASNTSRRNSTSSRALEFAIRGVMVCHPSGAAEVSFLKDIVRPPCPLVLQGVDRGYRDYSSDSQGMTSPVPPNDMEFSGER